MAVKKQLRERARKIKLLILDVDGVLTDGRIIYANSGDQLKFFDVKDGLGLYILSVSGIRSAILTAKSYNIVSQRSCDMCVDKAYQDVSDKAAMLETILSDFGVKAAEVCYIGDDLLDIPVLKRVGLAVGVADAACEVKETCHYVTNKTGGRGAVRETIELLLKNQGKWEACIERYLS